MRKTFSLHDPRKTDARLLEVVKHELRKYVQREQRKKLPADFDRWEFACKVGPTAESATVRPLSEVIASVDTIARGGAAEVFVEIVALPARRNPPEPSAHAS